MNDECLKNDTLHLRCIKLAKAFLGGSDALARHLGCSPRILARYQAGTLIMPPEMFLKLVDLVTADNEAYTTPETTPPHDSSDDHCCKTDSAP